MDRQILKYSAVCVDYISSYYGQTDFEIFCGVCRLYFFILWTVMIFRSIKISLGDHYLQLDKFINKHSTQTYQLDLHKHIYVGGGAPSPPQTHIC